MNNAQQILTELQEIAPVLAKADLQKTPFATPAGYFAEFPEMLMTRIQSENSQSSEPEAEISEISPLLARLRKSNPYGTPDGYFDKLKIVIPASDDISAKPVLVSSDNQTTVPGTRVISFGMRVIRYAAAACIAGLIGITAYNVVLSRQTSDPINGLSTVSIQDMANYLDDDDIHWAPDSNPVSETASMDFSDNDIHELLSSVPDAELEQYLPDLPSQKRTVN